ncbi:SDR family NAD(P)-dependent oxidoreductase, partial [Nocardia sp. NPDC058497]|uniref:SDR family NAD(P)-dependent oxidoreductase n=1 Tax=Nocardia sp. NPDC058497 TaxID=3346529 RepID=UPI003650AF25
MLISTLFAQTGLFAVGVATARLLEWFGLTPDMVAGHSIGEIVAAHVAGVLSLQDAVVLVAARARLMQALPPGGAMAALTATEAEVAAVLSELPVPSVGIAAVNGVRSVVISGSQSEVEAVAARLADAGRVRWLQVSHAFHSPSMDPMLAEFAQQLAGLEWREPSIPIVSNLSGVQADSSMLSPSYWVSHVRECVRFADGIRTLHESGVSRFVVAGPDGGLTGLISAAGDEDTFDADVVAVLGRNRAESASLLTALATVDSTTGGETVSWKRLWENTSRHQVPLPLYPFQRRPYWIEASAAGTVAPGPNMVEELTAPEQRLLALDWFAQADPAPPTVLSATEYFVTAESFIDWIAGCSAAPAVVVFDLRDWPAGTAVVDRLHHAAHEMLTVLQAWHGETRFEHSTLVVLTRHAVADDAISDVAAAAVWGLVRSAQSEDPGRIVLADIDSTVSGATLEAVLAQILTCGEPQVVIRDGVAHLPRMNRLPVSDRRSVRRDFSEGTVVITGGTGGLGALLARHLVKAHGVRSVLLASRRGHDAPGTRDLLTELTDAGAHTAVIACDVSTKAGVQDLLASVPLDAPLTGVIHAAGVLDDGVIATLTPDRLDTVLSAKADAAWQLHEAMSALDPALFVLFSSTAGVFGVAGQGNYAAANTFLDALAEYRRARGQAATSIAWGLWDSGRGMDARLRTEDTSRFARDGITAMAVEQGLAWFDAAIAQHRASVIAASVDQAALADLGQSGTLPPILRALVAVPRPTSMPEALHRPVLRERLAHLPDVEVGDAVLETVRTHVALALGHDDSAGIDPERNFRELGADSLTAVEIRNRLNKVTGLRLPATLVFDYPTPETVARFVIAQLHTDGPAAHPDVTATPIPVADEPVAIVGMGCRLPGGVSSPEDLWELVIAEGDAISAFPSNRGWNVENLFDPEPGVAGKSYVREGGFLHDGAAFDAEFFGISPREALAMDPQQRVLLETTWEALEHAGINPNTLRGSDTGVFVGIGNTDYGGDPAAATGYEVTGTSLSVASGRISYTLGLEGPAVSVDTACSSSLVALHHAAQALRSGECSMALAGGVTVMANLNVFVGFSQQRGLAADGRCKPFAEAADGTAWAEGAGVLVMERLSEARRLGHDVLAIVRGSAINQDGASNGLTAPNGPSQQRVIRRSLANAGLTASDVDVVEAHGTGTVLGDPIEAQAILATYGQDRRTDAPLWLGSLKSNIGHTQAAAGVA